MYYNLQKIKSLVLNRYKDFKLKHKISWKKNRPFLHHLKKVSFAFLLYNYNCADYASLREAIQTPQQQQHMSVKVLDTIMKSHEESISVLKACDENLKKAMVSYGESKIKLTQKLYEKLKSISEIQYNIKKLGKKLMTYISILNTLGNKFAHIELIHCLPGAYQLTLLEITRRGLFRRKLHAEVTQLEKNVQIIRDEEIALRKWFTKNIGRYLPPGLIRGLDENPPSYTLVCNTISESALPQIDSKEVRYIITHLL